VVGTAATPDLLRQLPADRVIVALDARHDEVLTHGWRQTTGRTVLDSMEELRGLCSGFLVTFVEREGRLSGTDLQRARKIVDAAGDASVTIAGGVTTPEEVAELEQIGADAQVGMALYTGRLDLADAIAATLSSDRPDGLWPTVVVDEHDRALGLAYSSRDSLAAALESRRGVYQSRSRGLWLKGESSGAIQELIGVSVDCDRDTLRFRVRQEAPGFCHLGSRTCFGEDTGLPRLEQRLATIGSTRPEGSNTVKLLDHPALLAAKLIEEATELGEAEGHGHVAEEIADVLYFALVKAAAAGVGLQEVMDILDRRERVVTRREMTA
jgi:phosphoribosyl-ATP pyrophosphohydrolase